LHKISESSPPIRRVIIELADYYDVPKSEVRIYLKSPDPSDPVDACLKFARDFGIEYREIKWFILQSGYGAID
jgi:hypothetical protein